MRGNTNGLLMVANDKIAVVASLSDGEVEIVDKAHTNVRVVGKKKWHKST